MFLTSQPRLAKLDEDQLARLERRLAIARSKLAPGTFRGEGESESGLLSADDERREARRITGEVWRKRVVLEFLTGDQIDGVYEVGSHVEDYAILALQFPLPESLAPVLLLDPSLPLEA